MENIFPKANLYSFGTSLFHGDASKKSENGKTQSMFDLDFDFQRKQTSLLSEIHVADREWIYVLVKLLEII